MVEVKRGEHIDTSVHISYSNEIYTCRPSTKEYLMSSTKRVAMASLGLTMGLVSARYLSRSITERRNRKRADAILAAAEAALKDGLIDAENYWEMHRPVVIGPSLTSIPGRDDYRDRTDETSEPLIQLRERLREQCLAIAAIAILRPYREQLLHSGAFPGKEFYFFDLERLTNSERFFSLQDNVGIFGIDMSPFIQMVANTKPNS